MKYCNQLVFYFVTLLPLIADSAVNIGEHITYQIASSKHAQSDKTVLVADIDERISIEWDEASLATELGIERGLIPKGDPLLLRIEFLKQVTNHFFATNVHLQEVKRLDVRLQSARRMRSISPNAITEAESAYREANKRFATEAQAGLNMVEEAHDKLEILNDKSLARSLFDALSEAVLVDYEEMSMVTGRFLADETERLLEELKFRAKEGESINVYMTARIHNPGASRALHLEGYDNIDVGVPIPYSRFQITVSERTKRELEAAESLGELIKESDKLWKEVEAAVMAVQENVKALTDAIEIEVIDKNLQNIESALRESADTTVGPLLEKVVQARKTIQTLSDAPKFTSSKDAAILIEIAGKLQTTVWELRLVAQNASREFSALADEIKKHVEVFPSDVYSQTLELLQRFSSGLKEDPDVIQIFERLDQIAAAVGLSKQVAENLTETARVGRGVLSDQPLDTWIELLTSGERHPGDMIYINAKITSKKDNERETTIAETVQRIQLRVIGFYVETRGALFFVDPRESELEDQSFEPAVALSYMGHVGFRQGSFWNTWVNPGFGLSLSLLDFEDSRDLELGLSGSLSIMSDFLYVGYGRNLQVKTDFFYIGVNPLVFSELLGQRK